MKRVHSTADVLWHGVPGWLLASLLILLFAGAVSAQPHGPSPLLDPKTRVDWWFIFKFNAESFPTAAGTQKVCIFGGTVQNYSHESQQFALASSADHTLRDSGCCLGTTTNDPLGATFDEVYNGTLFYVLWNDQFSGDPLLTEAAPWGHSKGLLAWDANGNGLVMQVSTPDWPASGSAKRPRKTDGNTLGCIARDNDIMVSQHFYALKLTKGDVVAVLQALANASVVTDPADPQIVNNGGPDDIQALVKGLGKKSKNSKATKATLSSGVILISKPSKLNVPPWQMVSALLSSEPLRAATWWTRPEIPTTTDATAMGCWDASLGNPGAVEIATSGTWNGKSIGLEGLADPDGNHAKIGVSTGAHSYAIFGDMNQQGALAPPKCKSSQNGRGGLFYVVDDSVLFAGVRDLIKGDTTPAQ